MIQKRERWVRNPLPTPVDTFSTMVIKYEVIYKYYLYYLVRLLDNYPPPPPSGQGEMRKTKTYWEFWASIQLKILSLILRLWRDGCSRFWLAFLFYLNVFTWQNKKREHPGVNFLNIFAVLRRPKERDPPLWRRGVSAGMRGWDEPIQDGDMSTWQTPPSLKPMCLHAHV